MSLWRRRARLVIAVFAVMFAIAVAFAFRRPAPPAPPPPATAAHTDPNVVVESTGGTLLRFNRTREDISVEYQKQLTYADGSAQLMGVRVLTNERAGGRRFTVTAKTGKVGKDESTIALDGDVKVVASDGLTVETEHATYADADAMVRAPGPVTFGRARMSGSGLGMTYNKNTDTLTVLDRAVLNIKPDEHGLGGTDVNAATATFARKDHYLRFERDVKIAHGDQASSADLATAALSDDGNHVEAVQLRGNSRIDIAHAQTGALRALTGRDIDLKYAASGETLEHALVVGNALIQLAADNGRPGRAIGADTVDITLAPDGSTPTAVTGRDHVQLTIPPDGENGARTIHAAALDATGQPGAGLTSARFTGKVDYRESGQKIERVARSERLDATMKPGTGEIEEALFQQAVRFEEGSLSATAISARYILNKGYLELTGTDPSGARPHVVNEQISVDADRIDLTLAGPKMKATGTVKSVLQAAKKGSETKTPSLLKQDQPTNVTGDTLDYDGAISNAVYTGTAQLWQIDTSIRGDTITIDDKKGDLAASGSVATSTMLEQVNADTKKKERVRSIGSSKTFAYQEDLHRATYETDAHLSGPQGDMNAAKIELYLKSGDELERAEGYDDLTLREPERKTTGSRLSYFAADERYVVLGTPATIVDACGQETAGRVITFFKTTDVVIVDGRNQMRTRSKGPGATSKCPGS